MPEPSPKKKAKKKKKAIPPEVLAQQEAEHNALVRKFYLERFDHIKEESVTAKIAAELAELNPGESALEVDSGVKA